MMKMIRTIKGNILGFYLKKLLLLLLIDVPIDVVLFCFVYFYFSSYRLTYYVTLSVIFASTSLLSTFIYRDYKDFSTHLNYLRHICDNDIAYVPKKNSILCRKGRLRLCLALETKRLYISKGDEFLGKGDDTKDFYCTRFELGTLKENSKKVFEGEFKALEEDGIKLYRGKSIIIEDALRRDADVKSAIEELLL